MGWEGLEAAMVPGELGAEAELAGGTATAGAAGAAGAEEAEEAEAKVRK